jgi:hypothetical protein
MRAFFQKSFITAIFCLALIALASPTVASPFLVCDPYDASVGVDLFQLELNGQVIADVQVDASGQYGFKFDLSGLADGSYTARARARNLWGWSNFSDPFDFVKSVPPAPAVIRITP